MTPNASRLCAHRAAWHASLALLLALVSVGATAFALSDAELEKRVQVITDDLRCPTCQGLSVKDSDAGFSIQIRDKVRHMVEEGQSDEDIKAYFVSRYGEWILRAPKKEGLGLVLWALPFAGIIAVGALLIWNMRRSAARAQAQTSTAPALTSRQRERLERDLQRFKED